MSQPARRPCGGNTRESRDQVDSGRAPQPPRQLFSTRPQPPPPRADKGRARALRRHLPAPAARARPATCPSRLRRYPATLTVITPTKILGKVMRSASARGGRALRKGRDVARISAGCALAAGARSGVARGVPLHSYATRRHCRPDWENRTRGARDCARTRIDTAPPHDPRPLQPAPARTNHPAHSARRASMARPPPSAIDITPETPVISGRNADTPTSFPRRRTSKMKINIQVTYREKYLVNYENIIQITISTPVSEDK